MNLWLASTRVALGFALSASTVINVQQAYASDPVSVFAGTRGERLSRSGAARWSAWLGGHFDLVFVGRWVGWEAETEEQARAGNGGQTIQCLVDSVLLGENSDSVVTFKRLTKPSFAVDVIRPGAHVLVMMRRACLLNGEACGNFFLISASGELLTDHLSDSENGQRLLDNRPLRLHDLDLDSVRTCEPRQELHGSEGVAIVTVRVHSARNGPAPCQWPCVEVTSAEWLIPGRGALPKFLLASPSEYCTSSDGYERRFLVAVPPDFKGDTLSLLCCMRGLRVRSTSVPGLNLTLEQLSNRLKRDSHGNLKWKE